MGRMKIATIEGAEHVNSGYDENLIKAGGLSCIDNSCQCLVFAMIFLFLFFLSVVETGLGVFD